MPKSIEHIHAPVQAERFASPPFPAVSPAAAGRRIGSVKAIWRLCLCGPVVVALLAVASPAHAQSTKPNSVTVPANRIADFVAEASERFSIPASWIRAVMRVESLGDAHALSPKGAMGLMQIMPDTWSDLRSRYGLGADPYDPYDNVMAGTAYLREMHDRYGERGFIAAYNAGPGRYGDHLATGRPLPSETLSYVTAVASLIGDRAGDGKEVTDAMTFSWASAPLFVPRSPFARPSTLALMSQRSADGTSLIRTALEASSDGLFVKPTGRNGRP